jgi:acyl phosphate:glycerol-3-phosphate acyltransferase
MSWDNLKFAPNATPGQIFCVLTVGYLLGCVATGYYLFQIVARKDIRQEGSGNTGARNVGRLLGPPGFVAVLFLDLGKGALAVWLVHRQGGNELLAVLAMLAVTAGHIWPVQLRFRAGKGVSPSLGALLVLDYHLAFAFAALAVVGLLLLRNFTLGGLLAFGLLPIAALAWHQSPTMVSGLIALAGLILFVHRKNLEEEILRLAVRRNPSSKPEQKT